MALGLVLSISVLLGIVLFLAHVYSKFQAEQAPNLLRGAPNFLANKVDCDRVQVSCSTDADCSQSCSFGLSCVQGACTSPYDTSRSCNVKLGQLAVYQYDPQLGQYRSTCFSVDPGVALENGSNVFCRGGDAGPVDYTTRYPNTCSCPPGKNLVPVWGNLTRRQTYGCTDSTILKKSFQTTRVVDHF